MPLLSTSMTNLHAAVLCKPLGLVRRYRACVSRREFLRREDRELEEEGEVLEREGGAFVTGEAGAVLIRSTTVGREI